MVAAISHKSFVWLHCKSTIIFKNCYLVPPALFNQCWQRLTRPTHEEILRKIQINFRDRQQEFLRSCAPSPVFALCRCRLCKTNLISAFEIVITKVAVRMKKKPVTKSTVSAAVDLPCDFIRPTSACCKLIEMMLANHKFCYHSCQKISSGGGGEVVRTIGNCPPFNFRMKCMCNMTPAAEKRLMGYFLLRLRTAPASDTIAAQKLSGLLSLMIFSMMARDRGEGTDVLGKTGNSPRFSIRLRNISKMRATTVTLNLRKPAK